MDPRMKVFRSILIDTCEQCFYQTLKPIKVPETITSEEEEFEFILNEKKKMKGNAIFVGELCKKGIIAIPVAMQCMGLAINDPNDRCKLFTTNPEEGGPCPCSSCSCFDKLLCNCSCCLCAEPAEHQFEVFCELMNTAAYHLYHHSKMKEIDQRMKRVNDVYLKDDKFSLRIRCLLQDVVDDWKTGFQKSAVGNKEGPMTLDDLQNRLMSSSFTGTTGGGFISSGTNPISTITSSGCGGGSTIIHRSLTTSANPQSGNSSNNVMISGSDVMRRKVYEDEFQPVHSRRNIKHSLRFSSSGGPDAQSHHNERSATTSVPMSNRESPEKSGIDKFFEINTMYCKLRNETPLERPIPHEKNDNNNNIKESFNTEKFNECLLNVTSQLIHHDCPVEGRLEEIEALLKEHSLHERTCISIISHCISLLFDSRIQFKLHVAEWLMGLISKGIITDKKFELGFCDFFENKLKLAKRDASKDSSLLRDDLRHAKEYLTSPEKFLEDIRKLGDLMDQSTNCL